MIRSIAWVLLGLLGSLAADLFDPRVRPIFWIIVGSVAFWPAALFVVIYCLA